MNRTVSAFLLLLLCLGALTTPALADLGPKPLLVVRVENAPEDYYLDLLAQDDPEGGGQLSDGLSWSYPDEARDALDEDLLAALRAAVPEGWHACTAEGYEGAPIRGQLYSPKGDGVHSFSYMGVPREYRLLLVTKAGEAWVSDTYTRQTLQSSVTVDWVSGAVSIEAIPTVTGPPAWKAYVLQFVSTLLPTLVIEGVVLLLFGFSLGKNWKPFLLVNLATQTGLFCTLGVAAVRHGIGFGYFFLLIPAELVILAVETPLYRRFLTGRSKRAATAYGVTANLLSALAGLFLALPLWQWVVSHS